MAEIFELAPSTLELRLKPLVRTRTLSLDARIQVAVFLLKTTLNPLKLQNGWSCLRLWPPDSATSQPPLSLKGRFGCYNVPPYWELQDLGYDLVWSSGIGSPYSNDLGFNFLTNEMLLDFIYMQSKKD